MDNQYNYYEPDRDESETHEEESIFSPITLEEQMLARAELVETGVNDAIANGLFDKAKENAEKMLASFFKQHDEYKDKEIVFEWK